MDPRLRAGLIAGGGAAVATLLLSLGGFVICGPILAIIAGLNAGFAMGRDPRMRERPVRAASIAGLYAGAFAGIAQIIGLFIFVATPYGQSTLNDALQQASQTAGVPATGGLLTIAIGCDALLFGLIDLGVAVGAAALLAQMQSRNQPQNVYQQQRYHPMPQYYPQPQPYQPPAPQEPIAAPAPQEPPPAYPPPPEFYGAPNVTPNPDAPKPPESGDQPRAE